MQILRGNSIFPHSTVVMCCELCGERIIADVVIKKEGDNSYYSIRAISIKIILEGYVILNRERSVTYEQ